MDEPKRYFTSKLGFVDGTDYIEFDNGKIAFVFINGARQEAKGVQIGQLEEAVERGIYEEYAKPPAGTIRSIIEKLETLGEQNGVFGEDQIDKITTAHNEAVGNAVRVFGDGKPQQVKAHLGDAFCRLVALAKSLDTDLITCARSGYEEIHRSLASANKVEENKDLIPVDFRSNG